MIRASGLVALVVALTACASTVDGHSWGDGGRRDAPPGVNPDGEDPFRPTDASVLLVDGSTDVTAWIPPDGAVFDPRAAYLWLGSYPRTGAPWTLVQAEFRLVPRPDETRCTYVSAGNWDVVTCHDGPSPRDPHPTPFPNPGPLSVTGGARPLTLRPTSQGQYAVFYEPSTLFRGPHALTISAPGSATVPALSLTVEMPAPLVLTEPSVRGGRVTVASSTDLALTWQPTTARSVTVSVTAQGTLEGRRVSVRVIADFNGAAGRGVIPRRAMAEFARLTAVTEVQLVAAAQNILTARVGNWPIQVSTQGEAVTAAVTLR